MPCNVVTPARCVGVLPGRRPMHLGCDPLGREEAIAAGGGGAHQPVALCLSLCQRGGRAAGRRRRLSRCRLCQRGSGLRGRVQADAGEVAGWHRRERLAHVGQGAAIVEESGVGLEIGDRALRVQLARGAHHAVGVDAGAGTDEGRGRCVYGADGR